MSNSNCCFFSYTQISQETGKVVWYSHLFKNFPVCCGPHSQRLSCSQWSRSRCFSETAFSMSQQMLAIWSLVLLPLDFPDSSVGKEPTCKVRDPGLIPGLGRSPGEGVGCPLQYSQASLVTQLVRNLPALWQIDPAPGFDPHIQKITWRRERLPLQYSGLENSIDFIVYGVTELDTTEWLSLSLS